MWPNPQKTADLVTFTEEILKEKLHFLCSVSKRYKIATLAKKQVSDAFEKNFKLNSFF